MGKKYTWNCVRHMFCVFFAMLMPLFAGAQSGVEAVDILVGMGFENVAFGENSQERVYVLQNSAYRLTGEGVGTAIDEIQKYGLPQDWNDDGKYGPERYIEVQVWSDETVKKYRNYGGEKV